MNCRILCAWLFQVARNAVKDNYRLRKQWVPVPEDLSDESRLIDPVDELDACIQRTPPYLLEVDREILQACDFGSMSQSAYARTRELSLPAIKARIRRARERLRETMAQRCKVVLDDKGKVCCHKQSEGLRS